jgi:hypothetical protein
MSEDRILKALNALKEADDGLEASPGVEARLMDAFRKHRSQSTRRRVTGGIAMLAAAVLFGIIERPKPAPVGQTIGVQWSVSPPVLKEPADDKPRSSAPRAPRRATRLREIATGFYPLLDVQPPFERGELIRVMVPAGTMRTVGLPVSEGHLEDLVEADVLVGQEGLARAIRFVGFQK